MQSKQKRWMKSVIEASKAQGAALPFQRSARKAFIARRAESILRKVA